MMHSFMARLAAAPSFTFEDLEEVIDDDSELRLALLRSLAARHPDEYLRHVSTKINLADA